MAFTKTYWRRKCAERLAARTQAGATDAEIDKAERLVWRLCRLAHDHERNCERDNDSWWMCNAKRAAIVERDEERWIERNKEISGLFKELYGCEVEWPGIYPTVYAIGGGSIDNCGMY